MTRKWLLNDQKKLRSAYHLRAGDRVTIIDEGTTVRVATKKSTAEGVELDLETELIDVQRYLARRRRLDPQASNLS